MWYQHVHCNQLIPVAPTGKPTEGGLRLRPPRSEDGTQTLSFHELLVAG